jgi:hypothetical protein
MTGLSIRESLSYILMPFADSLESDLIEPTWEYYRTALSSQVEGSAQADIQNLDILLSLMREKGYTAFTFQPATCEAIHAISGLPILSCALIIHFPGRRFEPLKKADVSSQNFILLSPHAEHIALHIIAATMPRAEMCDILTHDGLTWSTPVHEPIAGQVFGETREESRGTYCQAAAILFLTKLPAFEIEAHIDEWFGRLPYTRPAPKLIVIE